MPELEITTTGRTAWSKVADGRSWRLVDGIDFARGPRRAQQAFHAWCRYHDLVGTTRIDDAHTLVVRVMGPKSEFPDA